VYKLGDDYLTGDVYLNGDTYPVDNKLADLYFNNGELLVGDEYLIWFKVFSVFNKSLMLFVLFSDTILSVK